MVALQILVLSVKVRILMGQRILLVIELGPDDVGTFLFARLLFGIKPTGSTELPVINFSPPIKSGGFLFFKKYISIPIAFASGFADPGFG